MRQSSNDLTRMVRLYVTTGEPRYRRHYDEILAIRRGEAPRPVDYDSSYWDRVLAGAAGERTGPPRSLQSLMREAGFAAEEFTALNASLAASDALARTEREVMLTRDYDRLVDAAYHAQKGTIMAAIERFTRLVDARTAQRSDTLTNRTDRLLVLQTLTLIALAAVAAALFILAARRIARPLARLTAVTKRITQGDWSERAPEEGVAELKQLAADFNEMTDAVERDLGARRAAERRLQTIADRVPGAVFHFSVDEDGALTARFFSRGGEHRPSRLPLVRPRGDPDDRGAWLDGDARRGARGGPGTTSTAFTRDGGGIALDGGAALGCRRAPASSMATSPTSPNARRSRGADRRARSGRERRPRQVRFLATMSHELRTPLVAVSGTLDVLSTTALTAEQRHLTQIAVRSAHACSP